MSESGKSDEAPWSNDKQKMIKKLKEMNIYEDAMPEKEMKQLLEAINQSQDEANPGARNKNVNVTPEATRHENQASYSRGLNNAKVSNRESTSPELSANQTRRYSSQGKQRAGSGDETVFSPHGKNCFVKENKDLPPTNMNKTRFTINENSSEAIDNNKQSVQRTNSLMRNQETPKHRINPLDGVVSASDVPLQPHRRTFPDKERAEVGNSVNIDAALPQLSGHLQRIAESWLGQHGSFVRAQAAWGKAIQVGTDNGSLDKESVPDAMSEDAGPSETSVSCDAERRRRTCARKVVDYTAGEVVESDSDDEFRQSSRTKKTTKGLADSSDKSCQPRESIGNVATRRRKIIPKKDDIYLWEDTNEEDPSGSEAPKNAKKMKLAKRAESPEYVAPLGHQLNSNVTKKITNIAEQEDNTFEFEALLDEEDSDEESPKGAKRRKPTTKSVPVAKKFATARTRRQKSVEPSTREASEEQDETPVSANDPDEIMISDNEDNDQALRKSSRSRSEDAISSTSSVYPRRIVPPNPRGKFAGIRARKPLLGFFNMTRGKEQTEQDKEDDEEVARTNSKSPVNRRGGLQDDEISVVLENVDEAEEVIPPIDVEIRPLRISGRMKMQTEHLKALRAAEEQLESKRANEQKAREEQAQREKDEKIRERLMEQKLKIQREEREAKAKVMAEERWLAMMNQKGKKRQGERTELNPEGPRQNNDLPVIEEAREDRFETNDVEVLNTVGRSGEQPAKLVPCPICGKKYPAKRIEDHAATCEEFEATGSAGTSRSNSPATSTRSATSAQRGALTKSWECSVCSAFTTTDGKRYEDHVNKCITRHRDSGTNSNSCRTTATDIVVVPDSPIRGFRRISELTDSAINYKEQFVPKTKSNISNNRKRKRL